MEAVEYNTLDALDAEFVGGSGAGDGGGGGEETRRLEEMLVGKNKQLEGKLTEAKRAADAAEV